MKVTIKDRIVAHRSAPDVYDPPSFEQMADRIEELEAKLAKAVSFSESVVRYARKGGDGYLADQARTTIAELTGGKDG